MAMEYPASADSSADSRLTGNTLCDTLRGIEGRELVFRMRFNTGTGPSAGAATAANGNSPGRDALWRRNVFAATIHYIFLSASMALADPTTIIPALITHLTGSPALVGLTSSVLVGGGVAPQLLFARWIEPRPRKKTFMLAAVYVRAAALAAMGVPLLWLAGWRSGATIATAYLLFLAAVLIFSVAGGMGGVAYADVIGKVIPAGLRGRFYGTRQLFGIGAAFAAGLGAKGILAGIGAGAAGGAGGTQFYQAYASLFLIAGVSLFLGATGFILVKEPAGTGPAMGAAGRAATTQAPASARSSQSPAYFRRVVDILRRDRRLRALIVLGNVIGVHMMLAPFYTVYAQKVIGVPAARVGLFLLAVLLGNGLTTVWWGRIADRMGGLRALRLSVGLAAAVPLVALALGRGLPWAYAFTFLLVGMVNAGYQVATATYLLEIAPEGMRPTYAGIQGTLTFMTFVFPAVGGLFIERFSFAPAFIASSIAIALALAATRRPVEGAAKPEYRP